MQKREERKTLKLEKMVWRKRGPVLDASVSSPAFFYLELFLSLFTSLPLGVMKPCPVSIKYII